MVLEILAGGGQRQPGRLGAAGEVEVVEGHGGRHNADACVALAVADDGWLWSGGGRQQEMKREEQGAGGPRREERGWEGRGVNQDNSCSSVHSVDANLYLEWTTLRVGGTVLGSVEVDGGNFRMFITTPSLLVNEGSLEASWRLMQSQVGRGTPGPPPKK